MTRDIVRALVGRRSRITRAEMSAILRALDDAQPGWLASNSYVSPTDGDADHAAAWVRMCGGITVISVAQGGLRDGWIRHDEPGSMHPGQHAELTFVSSSRVGDECDTNGYLRRHADRVLIVRDDPEPDERPVDASAPARCECEQGHRWQTADPDRDWQCLTCGEGWV